MRLLEGRVAIVTGAARGIGYAIAEKFAKHGAKVALVDILGDIVKDSAEKIRQLGGEAVAYQADVSSRERMKEVISDVLKKFGKVDILVNNAGIHRGFRPFWEETEELWKELFKVNVLGVLIPSQLVVPHMIERKYGKIINMSSKAAIEAEPNHAAYSASKAAILTLTRVMAVELAPYNIKVNAICPGAVETHMLLTETTEEQRKRMKERALLKRLAKPEDVAGAALFLASDESDYVTGQAIGVDGGMSIIAADYY